MSQSRNRRSGFQAAAGWWLALPLLLIVAAGVGLRVANTRIQENGYLHLEMNRLVAVELRKGISLGLYTAALVLAGAALFFVLRQILRRLIPATPTAQRRRLLCDAIALATWFAGGYFALPLVEDRLPRGFPISDVPTIFGAGVIVGAAALLHAAAELWLPGLRVRWVKGMILTLGTAAAVTVVGIYAYARWARPAVTPGKPNVVLIVMDTVRAQNLSLYGYHRNTTPMLDAYASECAVYDNAYSVAPWTIPNHAALFTGLYTSQHGARLGAPQLRGVLTTVAEILCQEGFETVGYANNPVIGGGVTGFEQGFETWYMPWRRTVANLWRVLNDGGPPPRDEGAYTTGRMVARWLQHRDDSRPFFLFINYLEAHNPYWGPESHRFRFLEKPIEYDSNIASYDWVAHASGARIKTAEQSATSEALYDAEILYLDQRIGELVDVLREQGLDDDTVVVITSDHGEEFGEHGLVGHAFGLYNTLIRIPLIVRYPGRLPAGRYDQNVQLVDIFSTILDGTHSAYPVPSHVQGKSLFGVDKRTEIYAENYHEFQRFQDRVRERFPDADVSHYVATLRSFQIGDSKLISSSAEESELYRTGIDPHEQSDIAIREPEQLGAMERRIAEWFDSTRTPLIYMERGDRTESEEIRKKLRALGYLH